MDEQLAAQIRLIDEIETARIDEIGQFFIEHLAKYGPGDLDIGALARQVLARIDEES